VASARAMAPLALAPPRPRRLALAAGEGEGEVGSVGKQEGSGGRGGFKKRLKRAQAGKWRRIYRRLLVN